MAQRATSLGPKPSLFYLFCFFVLFVFFDCFCYFFGLFFFGGFEGQVRWPKGPPHLALNPPYFICFCFYFGGGGFLVFASARKNLFPPLKRAFCVFFLSLPLFLLFSVSLSLSLSLSLFLGLSLVLFLFPSLLFFISVSGYCFSFFVLFAFFF